MEYALQHKPKSADTIPFEVCGFRYFLFSSYFLSLHLFLDELDAVSLFLLTKVLI